MAKFFATFNQARRMRRLAKIEGQISENGNLRRQLKYDAVVLTRQYENMLESTRRYNRDNPL